MSEQATIPEARTETTTPDDNKPKAEDFKFPALASGPSLFYETDKHEVWLGIPFDKINDPHMVTAALDRAKFDALLRLSEYHQDKLRQQQFSISPRGNRLKKTMSDIFEKGKSLIMP